MPAWAGITAFKDSAMNKCPGKEEPCGRDATHYPTMRIGGGDPVQYIDISLSEPYCAECLIDRARQHVWDEDEETEEEFFDRVGNIPEAVDKEDLFARNPRLWRQIELYMESRGLAVSKDHVGLRWDKGPVYR